MAGTGLSKKTGCNTMSEPLVSVCLPVYNGEQYLAQSIESVLAQSYSNFELLIADDCSGDSSTEICQQFAKLDKRIRFWRNDTTRGLFANYNRCIKRASGTFIKPFAQDDVLHPEMLAKSVAVLQSHKGVSLLSVGRSWINADGADITECVTSPLAERFVPADCPVPGSVVIRKALSPVTNFIGEPVAVLFRAALKGAGFDEDLAHIGDLEYWIRLLNKGSFYFLSEVLCSYRSHPESQTRRNWENCSISTDFLKLGEKCTWVLDEVGIAQEDFIAKNIQSAAVGAVCIWDGERLEAVPIEDPFSPDISATPRERALMQVLTSIRKLPLPSIVQLGHDAYMRDRVVKNAKSIRALERKLSTMLSSSSWRCTKPLRDLNRLIGSSTKAVDIVELAEKKLPDPVLKGLDEQRAYMSYLRKVIGAVRCSRSWRVTAPLRMFQG